MAFRNILLQTVAMECVADSSWNGALDTSDMAKLSKFLVYIVFDMDEGDAVVKLGSAKRIGKNEHRTTTIRTILIRSKPNLFGPLAYDGQVVRKIGIQNVAITQS